MKYVQVIYEKLTMRRAWLKYKKHILFVLQFTLNYARGSFIGSKHWSVERERESENLRNADTLGVNIPTKNDLNEHFALLSRVRHIQTFYSFFCCVCHPVITTIITSTMFECIFSAHTFFGTMVLFNWKTVIFFKLSFDKKATYPGMSHKSKRDCKWTTLFCIYRIAHHKSLC